MSYADGVLVHDGFHETQGRTADIVLSTVQSALSSSGFTRVLCTGHSLGAAVALLDSTMLRMTLPSSVEVDSVVFGLPRVGNQQFADYIDAHVRFVPGSTFCLSRLLTQIVGRNCSSRTLPASTIPRILSQLCQVAS